MTVPALLRRATMPLRLASRRAGAASLELLVRGAAALHGVSGTNPSAADSLPDAPRSIFILRNNDIGDLLVVTPLFAALRRRFPEAAITAGVGRWSLPVLERNPHLTEVLTVEAPWFNKYQGRQGTLNRLWYLARSPQVRELKQRRFAVGIDVLGSAWGSLLLLRAGIPYRLGVSGYAGGDSAAQDVVTFDPSEHVSRAALRFAELLGATALPPCRPQLFLSPEEAAAGEQWWAASAGDRRGVRVVIGPGGGLAQKCWPGASFLALAGGLRSTPGLSVLALGGPRERQLTAAVAAAAGGRSHDEPPGLREVFALVAASDLVICNSSMLLHVAAAFAKPTLTLLGPAFLSASQHQAQWGYEGICRSLGREPAGRGVATPTEALEAVREHLAKLPIAGHAGDAAARA
jgi:ADP-heptose:LPS heptosyltransferase